MRKGQKTQGSNSILSQAEVYSKAQEAAGFDRADWGLIVLSSVIASYGLVTENVIAVIGAMMLAPMLSPFVASAISLTVGDRKLLTESIKSGSLSILLAMAVSLVSVMPMPVEMNSLLSLVSEPSLAGIVLSVSVGAAAALTFVTGFRDQIAGVAVAIALVPPIASIGIGLKMQDLQLVTRASSVAAINLLAIIFSGFLCFKLLGLKPSTYYRKKQAEQIRYVIPAVLVVFGLIAAPVAFSSYQSYQEYVVEEQIEHQAEQVFGEKLLKANISGRKATLYVIGTVNEQDFRKSLPETAEVEIVRLQETS